MAPSRWPAAFLVLLLWPAGTDAGAGEQERPSPALANPVAAQSLDKLSSTLSRPLFSPSRKPPAPPPPPPPPVVQATPPPAPPPPPNLVLFGVVMDGEDARAVVRTGADKKMLRARIGDEIDGWKVSQIEGRKVVLSQDGRLATFTLFTDDRGRSDTVGSTAQGGEPRSSKQQVQAEQTLAPGAAPQSEQPRKRRRSRE
jgi:type II secretory pathway component PulC